MTLDIHSILQYLPHRYPFLLVDKVITLLPGESIETIKNVTFNEPFFQGHFPEQPIMPGVLILEAIAQTTAILALYEQQTQQAEEKSLYLLAAINNTKFKAPVIPGDQMHIKAQIQWTKARFTQCNATVQVGEICVCTAEIIGAKQPITH